MRISGRWRIMEAELWDRDALNLVAPAFIEFAEDGSGSFGFIAVQGEMDCREAERDGRPGVDLHTADLWPRPGRVLIAARTATFEQLGKAIDDAFARWDHNHLHEFTLSDGTVIIPVRWWDGEEPEGSLDGAKARLRPGEQFAYTFDLGDNWQHLCTVAPQRADPLETLGIIPVEPLPCWGWGDIPDQYGRRWDGDDGSSPMPKAPNGLADLPPILPGRGPGRARPAASPADDSVIRYRDLITGSASS